jgi:hypothetical protein
MVAESRPRPLEVVAALEHQMATFDQLVGLLKADRAAVEQGLVEATRKVWVVTTAQAPLAGYSPETQLRTCTTPARGCGRFVIRGACDGKPPSTSPLNAVCSASPRRIACA